MESLTCARTSPTLPLERVRAHEVQISLGRRSDDTRGCWGVQPFFAMEKAAWQVLPPRKKGRRAEKGADGAETGSSSEGIGGTSTSSLEARQAKIAENIASRAEKSASGEYADATLEGKDGCAGEFYEYLDHTADVQCHSWGATLEAAFENMAPCMFNYMTDLALVKEDEKDADGASGEEMEVKGHDMKSLLFNYMDEMLFRFCTDQFCVTRVKVHSLTRGEEKGEGEEGGGEAGESKNKEDTFYLKFTAFGATYDRSKHVQGTEVKAITYSAMQIHEKKDRSDLFVIVDI